MALPSGTAPPLKTALPSAIRFRAQEVQYGMTLQPCFVVSFPTNVPSASKHSDTYNLGTSKLSWLQEARVATLGHCRIL